MLNATYAMVCTAVIREGPKAGDDHIYAILRADSERDAIDMANKIAHVRFPEADGWKDHRVHIIPSYLSSIGLDEALWSAEQIRVGQDQPTPPEPTP